MKRRIALLGVIGILLASSLVSCSDKGFTEQNTIENNSIPKGESTAKQENSSNNEETTLIQDIATQEESTTKQDAIGEEKSTAKQEIISEEKSTIRQETISEDKSTTKQEAISEDKGTTIQETISGEEDTTTQYFEQENISFGQIDVSWNVGYINHSGQLIDDNADYVYTDLIELSPNSVLKYRATGSKGVALLAMYDTNGNYKKTIETGAKWHVIDRYYHANETCFVRICRRKTDNESANCFEVGDYATYIMEKDVLMKSPLYGKTLLAIGDSLINGNKIGNDAVWVNQLGMKYNMQTYNYGINGNAISSVKGAIGLPMSERYLSIYEEVQNPDIIIVEGGANDKNNNCPIGENTDNTNETFKGALNVLIDGLREKYPGKTILFMTCFERYGSKNKLGLTETDYAKAMLEICQIKGIPCFDNVNDSGISLLDDSISKWADEGLYLEDVKRKNKNFSPKAYAYLADIYEKWICDNIN